MSKLDKLNIFKRNLVIFSLCLLVCMVVGILMIIPQSMHKEFNAGYQSRKLTNYNCLKKGEVCTQEDINRAIKVQIQVNEEETRDFYLISNDEESATFIMADNLEDDVDWHVEGINFRGPTKAIRQLLTSTENWYNLPIIASYKYEDFGNYWYNQKCGTIQDQLSDLLYDCAKDITPARGYKDITIDENGLTINFNIPKDTNMPDHVTYEVDAVYARLPSLEDIMDMNETVVYPEWLIDNLEDGEGFWTMSSSTNQTYNYNMAAYAVVNYNGTARLIELMTLNDMNNHFKKIGIRPVITIDK